MTRASWVDDALRLPVAFAQVREDALLDLALLERAPPDARVTMIASGGCTAAALAASGRVAELELVDVNAAQLALARLKLAAVAQVEPAARPALMGHAAMEPAERAERLRALGVALEPIGPDEVVFVDGPDRCGRYERVFAQVRRELAAHGDLEAAFAAVMTLETLQRLFGAGASQGTRQPFARHFASRTRAALARSDAARNPYLAQVVDGCYPPDARAPWLDAVLTRAMPRVRYVHAPMGEALGAGAADRDLVHLSNTLDWLAPPAARVVLERARARLAPGGWLIVRQLNSVLDVPGLLPDFGWDAALGRDLHLRDRSFFYHAIHVGCRA